MKKLFFILFFVPLISYCQTDSEFILQKSIGFGGVGNNCITNNDCFSLSPFDFPNNFYRTIFYTYKQEANKQVIDSISDDFYNIKLNSFKHEKNNSYVILLRMESEYISTFYIYYIKEGKIMKIGIWDVLVPYEKYNCEFCGYSIEDFRIHQRNDDIEFSFLKDVRFFVWKDHHGNSEDWGTYNAGELKVAFNIADGTIREIK